MFAAPQCCDRAHDAATECEHAGNEDRADDDCDPAADDLRQILTGENAARRLHQLVKQIKFDTCEIQRNMISERLLGMPKEPRANEDGPFQEARRTSGPGRR